MSDEEVDAADADDDVRFDAAMMRVTSSSRGSVLRRLDESSDSVVAKVETVIGIAFLVMVVVVIVNVVR